jgi:exopolyphosphatase/guanosine-5'-triphosphate,3'-diphosphate pyrophosphatase
MEHRRLAVLDLGTNSIRFDVQEITGSIDRPVLREVHREKLMVRLGEGAFLRGRLSAAARRRTLAALSRYERMARALGAERTLAFGTAALREARDASSFIREVRALTGIRLRVISGLEEARLIAEGVLAHERKARGLFALIDIGGGSTEISICRDGSVLHSASFPLGVARLQQTFLKTIPPRGLDAEDGAVARLRKHVRQLVGTRAKRERWPTVRRVLGSSGTVRAFAKMLAYDRRDGTFSRASLKRLVHRMVPMTPEQLLQVRGMEPKRVDLILAGGIVLEECVRAIGAEEISATEFALRDGLLLREARELLRRRPEGSPAKRLLETAERLCEPAASLAPVLDAARKLYDVLQPLHRLEEGWRLPFLGAAVFRAVGARLAPEEPSRFAVPLLDSVPLGWTAKTLTRARRLAEAAEHEDDRPVRRLAPLLEVVDALEPRFGACAEIETVRAGDREVRLVLKRSTTAELAMLLLQQRKGRFESTFRRSLVVTT